MIIEYDTTTGASGTHRWSDAGDRPPEALPTVQYCQAVGAAVDASRTVRLAMYRERHVRARFAREYGVGWDADRGAWVLPVWDSWGRFVNCTWRPPKGKTMRWKGRDLRRPMRLAGRRAENGCLPLWPDPPTGDAGLLVAGEWDALAALQAGLPAFTGLLGCQWHPAWDEHVVDKRIAVAYDRGEEAAAARTVAQLRAAGAAEAWLVELAPLGLRRPGDDVCDYFKRGGTARDLRRLIKAAKP